MAAGEIHLNDVGILFQSTLLNQDNGIIDVSAASVIQFVFERPDGTILTVPAYFITNGHNGEVGYMTIDGDLNQTGLWRYQIYLELGPDKKHSDTTKFKVFPNLPV